MKTHLTIDIPSDSHIPYIQILDSDDEQDQMPPLETKVEILRQEYVHRLKSLDTDTIFLALRERALGLIQPSNTMNYSQIFYNLISQLQNPELHLRDPNFMLETKHRFNLHIYETLWYIITELEMPTLQMEPLLTLLEDLYRKVSLAQSFKEIEEPITYIMKSLVKKIFDNFSNLYEENSEQITDLLGMSMSFMLLASASEENNYLMQSFQEIEDDGFFTNINKEAEWSLDSANNPGLNQLDIIRAIEDAYVFTYLQLQVTVPSEALDSDDDEDKETISLLNPEVHLTHKTFLNEHLNFCTQNQKQSLELLVTLEDTIRKKSGASLEEKNPFHQQFNPDFINMLAIYHDQAINDHFTARLLKSLFDLVSIIENNGEDLLNKWYQFLICNDLVHRSDPDLFGQYQKLFEDALKIIQSGTVPYFENKQSSALTAADKANLTDSTLTLSFLTNPNKRKVRVLFTQDKQTNSKKEKLIQDTVSPKGP